MHILRNQNQSMICHPLNKLLMAQKVVSFVNLMLDVPPTLHTAAEDQDHLWLLRYMYTYSFPDLSAVGLLFVAVAFIFIPAVHPLPSIGGNSQVWYNHFSKLSMFRFVRISAYEHVPS